MRKFKLKQWYPSLPKTVKAGDICEFQKGSDSTDLYLFKGSPAIYVGKHEVENYPDFWEELFESNYEILSFKGCATGFEYRYCSDDNYRGPCHPNPLTLAQLLGSNFHQIYQVKRLSDGEVFTIGDKINVFNSFYESYSDDLIIRGFNITKKNIMVASISDIFDDGYYDKKGCSINIIRHAKQPLFKTEDGVDIFEGDKFWFVANQVVGNAPGELLASSDNLSACHSKARFSNREAAMEYIIMNKPCISINDLIAVNAETLSELRKIVIDKLNIK